MGFDVRCGCGHQWGLRPEDFGRDIPCPKCRALMKIPGTPGFSMPAMPRDSATIPRGWLVWGGIAFGVLVGGLCVIGIIIKSRSDRQADGTVAANVTDEGNEAVHATAEATDSEPPSVSEENRADSDRSRAMGDGKTATHDGAASKSPINESSSAQKSAESKNQGGDIEWQPRARDSDAGQPASEITDALTGPTATSSSNGTTKRAERTGNSKNPLATGPRILSGNWELNIFAALVNDPANGRGISPIALSPDGETVFVGGVAGGIVEVKVARGALVREYLDPEKNGRPLSLCLSNDGKFLGVCRSRSGGQNSAEIWDCETGKILSPNTTPECDTMALLPGGTHCLVGHAEPIGYGKTDGQVVMAPVGSMQHARLFDLRFRRAHAIALSRDGKQMVVVGDGPGGRRPTLAYYWDDIGEQPAQLGERRSVKSARAARRQLEPAAQESTLAKVLPTKSFTLPEAAIGGCASFSSDGSRVATGCVGGALYISDVGDSSTAELRGCAATPESACNVTGVDFVRNDTLLVSSEIKRQSKGLTVRFWSVETHKELANAQFGDGVTPLVCDYEKSRAVYGAADGTVRVIDLARLLREGFELEPEIADEHSAEGLKATLSPESTAPALDGPLNLRSVLAGREKDMKELLLRKYGGNADSEAAVAMGLAWIARNQRQDGSWSLKGPYRSGAVNGRDIPESATAMALLAFQGAGHTHLKGEYKKQVADGMNALLKMQGTDGNFFLEGGSSNHWFYAHAQCTIAVCELYGMTKDQDLRRPAELAVKYCIDCQEPELGGWRYLPRSDSDTSVTGWIVTALQSARMAGLGVPGAVLEKIGGYLDKVTPDGSRYGYQVDMDPTLTMTAEALLCRQYLGWRRDDPRLVHGIEMLSQNLPRYEDRDVYYWYYGTQVFHNMEGKYWKMWSDALREMLVKHQESTGLEKGSWDPLGQYPDRWANLGQGGRLYTTCLSLYMLEAYYRHLPVHEATSPVVAETATIDTSLSDKSETFLSAEPVASGLKKKVTISFSQKTFEEALVLLSRETGVQFGIRSKDVQDVGAKKRLSLDEKDQPAAQILHKMLKLVDPAGNVIYIVKGNGAFTANGDGEGNVIVTTRAAAKEQGIPLPPERDAPLTARDEADEKATIDDLLPKINDWTFGSNVLKALWQPVDVKYDAASNSATVMLSVKQNYIAEDASHFRGRHVQCVFYDSRAKALAVTNGSLPKQGNQGDEVKATIKLPNRDVLERTKRVLIRVDVVRLK